jgi:tetratricopeptide (TPR) repeat protein
VAKYFKDVPQERSGGIVGRTDLVTRAVDLLGRNEDVAFVGLGGVGKSALASRLAREDAVRALLPDGVFWLSVGRTGEGAPVWRLKLLEWARVLGKPADRIAQAEAADIWDMREGPKESCRLFRESLEDTRALLVFDDVWEESHALLLKDIGAECRRVLTTREGDLANTFSGAGTLRVDDLQDEDARELFDRLAPTVAQWRPETAQECIAAVGRLPLVLVIVASYLQARVTRDPTCLDEALNEVLDVRKRLELAPRMPKSSLTLLPEDTAATLNAVIGLSAERLPEEDRRALTSLAAFPPKLNSFSWEAAQAVATPMGADASKSAVLTLRQYSLVEDFAGEGRRLTMHQTIHDYAASEAAGDPDAYRRMAEYFLVFISAEQDSTGDTEKWLLALEQEKDNIAALLEWAIGREETLVAYRLMAALWDYWYRRSRYARARELAGRILALKLEDNSQDSLLLRAKLLNDTGNFAYNMADLDQAERCHLEALKIRDELAHDTVAGSLNNLGLIYRERGRYDDADSYFTKALKRNREAGNEYWEALNLDNLGINARCSGDLGDSAAYLEKAAEIFARRGDGWGLAMTRIDLALTLVDQGQLEEARETFTTILADRWKVEDQKLSAAALRGLAAVSSAGRRTASPAEPGPEPPLDLLAASLALSVPILDRLGENQSLIGLIAAYGDEGDHRNVACVAGILGALRASTGLATQLGEQATARAVSEARATLAGTFDRLKSEGRAAATAESGVLDVEHAVKPLLKDIDVNAVVAKATAGTAR